MTAAQLTVIRLFLSKTNRIISSVYSCTPIFLNLQNNGAISHYWALKRKLWDFVAIFRPQQYTCI